MNNITSTTLYSLLPSYVREQLDIKFDQNSLGNQVSLLEEYFKSIDEITLVQIRTEIMKILDITDIDKIEESLLPYFSYLLGYIYDPSVPAIEQRAWIKNIVQAYKRRGTENFIKYSAWEYDPELEIEEQWRKIFELNKDPISNSEHLLAGPDRVNHGIFTVETEMPSDLVRDIITSGQPGGTIYLIDYFDKSLVDMNPLCIGYIKKDFISNTRQRQINTLNDTQIKETFVPTPEFGFNIKEINDWYQSKLQHYYNATDIEDMVEHYFTEGDRTELYQLKRRCGAWVERTSKTNLKEIYPDLTDEQIQYLIDHYISFYDYFLNSAIDGTGIVIEKPPVDPDDPDDPTDPTDPTKPPVDPDDPDDPTEPGTGTEYSMIYTVYVPEDMYAYYVGCFVGRISSHKRIFHGEVLEFNNIDILGRPTYIGQTMLPNSQWRLDQFYPTDHGLIEYFDVNGNVILTETNQTIKKNHLQKFKLKTIKKGMFQFIAGNNRLQKDRLQKVG